LKGVQPWQTILKELNVAILVTDGFEQVELTEPRKALDEAGATTKIVSHRETQLPTSGLRAASRQSVRPAAVSFLGKPTVWKSMGQRRQRGLAKTWRPWTLQMKDVPLERLSLPT
jgi:putative intracellular protease/amidase